MKQLKRLKNMLGGGEDTEESKKTEKQKQSETETKTEEKESKSAEVQGDKPEKSAKEEAEKSEETVKKKKTKKTKKTKKSKKEKSEPTEKSKEQKEEQVKESEKVDEKPKTKRSDSMTLLEGREVETLTRDSIDVNFKQEVMDAGAETLALCFQCGTCTGACPSGRRTPYRIRQIVRKSVMGLKEQVISDDTLWMCTTCYECQERCPRGIKIVDIVKIARNYASQAGYMAKAHKMTGSFVIKTGHGVPINDATMALRKSVGLSELPPTTHQFPEALEEVQAIFKKTGFDNLIGYNWESGTID
jgi:heterodisulfide reductase subunit C2